jgi:hypothetical protein
LGRTFQKKENGKLVLANKDSNTFIYIYIYIGAEVVAHPQGCGVNQQSGKEKYSKIWYSHTQ